MKHFSIRCPPADRQSRLSGLMTLRQPITFSPEYRVVSQTG